MSTDDPEESDERNELVTPLESDETDNRPDSELVKIELESEPDNPEVKEWEREFPAEESVGSLPFFRNYLLDEIGFNHERAKTDILGELYFDETEEGFVVTYRFEDQIVETYPEVREPILLNAGKEVQRKAVENEVRLSEVEAGESEQYPVELKFNVDIEYAIASAEELADVIPKLEEDFGLTRYSTPEDNY